MSKLTTVDVRCMTTDPYHICGSTRGKYISFFPKSTTALIPIQDWEAVKQSRTGKYLISVGELVALNRTEITEDELKSIIDSNDIVEVKPVVDSETVVVSTPVSTPDSVKITIEGRDVAEDVVEAPKKPVLDMELVSSMTKPEIAEYANNLGFQVDELQKKADMIADLVAKATV